MTSVSVIEVPAHKETFPSHFAQLETAQIVRNFVVGTDQSDFVGAFLQH